MRRHPILARLALVLAGFGMTALLLTGVELALRALDLGAEATHDPFAGFTSLVPLFEPTTRGDGTAVYRTARARGADDDGPAEFLVEKPADGYRIFVVGGSSAAGVPYGYRYAFSGWLERRLQAALPERTIEVVNAAISGYSSRRALMVVREIAAYEPDLLIVYSGHNERSERRFYEHLLEMDPRLFALRQWLYSARLYRLASRLFAVPSDEPPKVRFDELRNADQMFAVVTRRVRGDDLQDAVDREYEARLFRFNLEAMIEAMRQVDADSMLLSLSQDFADWPPGTSSNSPNLTLAARARFDVLLDEGRARALEDCAAALPIFEQALEIDSDFAALHFDIANCARELGQANTREHYRLASDLDRVPLGASTAYNEIIRDVAARHDAVFVDVFALMEELSPDGLVGQSLFVDLLHPNLRAHQRIAETVAERLRAVALIEESEAWRSDGYQEDAAAAILDAQPELLRKEHFVRAVACLLSQERACALRSTRALLDESPDDPQAAGLDRQARQLPERRRARSQARR